MRRTTYHQHGVTLIELVVAITIVAIAVTSVLGVLSSLAIRSGEAMIRAQATAIADAYLEEVLQKPFGIFPGTGARVNFDDINDYNGLNDNGVRDANGNAVAGLAQFTVRVRVIATALGAVPATQARRVDATVTHATGLVVSLSGYRTQYP